MSLRFRIQGLGFNAGLRVSGSGPCRTRLRAIDGQDFVTRFDVPGGATLIATFGKSKPMVRGDRGRCPFGFSASDFCRA